MELTQPYCCAGSFQYWWIAGWWAKVRMTMINKENLDDLISLLALEVLVLIISLILLHLSHKSLIATWKKAHCRVNTNIQWQRALKAHNSVFGFDYRVEFYTSTSNRSSMNFWRINSFLVLPPSVFCQTHMYIWTWILKPYTFAFKWQVSHLLYFLGLSVDII